MTELDPLSLARAGLADRQENEDATVAALRVLIARLDAAEEVCVRLRAALTRHGGSAMPNDVHAALNAQETLCQTSWRSQARNES